MSAFWQTPAALLALLTWLHGPSTGLADIAKKEAVRRQLAAQATQTLTNLGQPLEIPPPSAVTLPTPPPAAGEEPPTVEASPPAGQTPPAKDAKDEKEGPHDEQWWRQRWTSALEAIEQHEATAAALQSRINVLQADAVNIDDPLQQAKARNELAATLSQLDQMKKQVDADRQVIDGIRDEARRLNVPPGWIR